MKIAFDAQLLFEKQKTGIGWNSKMMIDSMIQDKSNEYQLNYFCVKHNPETEAIIQKYREEGCVINQCSGFSARIFNHLSRIVPVPYQLFFGRKSQITQFFNYMIPAGVFGKKVTIIHDMTYKAYPETVGKRTRLWLERGVEQYCKRADIILTVSEFSRREIVKYLSIPEKKIKVVPNGVDLELYRDNYSDDEIGSARAKYQVPAQYVLYLGTLEPRKNIERLIEAYAKLKMKADDCPSLVLAGKKGWMYDGIFDKVKKLKLENAVVFTGYVEENDVPCLLAGAKFFLFPSIYEGFGMPPLEAMACGTPVIASNTSSLPEVVGDAGILVNPESVDEITQAMNLLLTDENKCCKLIEKGKERVKQFTWKRSAESLIQIYRDMMSG